MAQVDMPDNKQPQQAKIEYNDRLAPVIDYNVTGSGKPKTGFAKWLDDIFSSLNEEIIKPTLMNLLRDVIVRGADKAIFHDQVRGGYTNYSTGYSNATWNPNAAYQYNNRFNSNDVYARPVGGPPQPREAEDWRCFRFRTKADINKVVDSMKQRIYTKGFATIIDYGDLCKKSVDWTLGSYGWRRFDESCIAVQYCMDGKRDEQGFLIPFMLVPPTEEYINR